MEPVATTSAPPLETRASALAACLSSACAIHCFATPFLFVAMPVSMTWVSPRVEGIVIGLSLVLAGFSLVAGVRRHGRRLAFLPFAVALAGAVASRLPALHAVHPWMTLLTGAGLIAAWLVNRRLGATCGSPCCD